MAEKGLKRNVVGLFGGTMLGIHRWGRHMHRRSHSAYSVIHESAHAMRPHEHLVQ
jgi:hypothetical protein